MTIRLDGHQARDGRQETDWAAVELSPGFRELVARRRRFVLPATVFFLAWYSGFILLAGYAPSFMGESIYQGFTVGYALAFSQFLMVWALVWLYNRTATRVFDPLQERALSAATAGARTGRFERDAATEREEVPR